MFANTTAIAYHQSLAALGTLSPVCNSSCVRKRQKITSTLTIYSLKARYNSIYNSSLPLGINISRDYVSNLFLLNFSNYDFFHNMGCFDDDLVFPLQVTRPRLFRAVAFPVSG